MTGLGTNYPRIPAGIYHFLKLATQNPTQLTLRLKTSRFWSVHGRGCQLICIVLY